MKSILDHLDNFITRHYCKTSTKVFVIGVVLTISQADEPSLSTRSDLNIHTKVKPERYFFRIERKGNRGRK